MQQRIWEKVREGTRPYRRRRPEKTELYRIVYQERDNLERVWEDRFQPEYGCLREAVTDTLDRYLNCGILAHGYARAECQKCSHSIVIAFSCKKRGVCPSCAAKRAVIFAEHLHKEILPPVPKRHIVFSLPKRLRVFFKYNRDLNSLLFHTAWDSLRNFMHAAIPGSNPGAVLVVQTSGESVNFNPHLHGLISSGAFLPTGSFIPLEKFDTDKLTTLFAHKVLSALKAKGLLSETHVAQILGQTHSGFSVWVGDEVPKDDQGYRLFLARYIDRGPVANSKISITDDIVTYLTDKDPLTHEFDAVEFLARLTPHIPNKWEQTTRFYGYYSHRSRGKRHKKQQAAITVLDPMPSKTASKSWAALIKRIFEVDPLTCPVCQGDMKIKAFVTDTLEVARFLKSLGIPLFEKPSSIKPNAPPETLIPDPEYLEHLAACD